MTLEQSKAEAHKNFEPVYSLLDKGDQYIWNSDYDKGLPSSRYLVHSKLDAIIDSTHQATVEEIIKIAEGNLDTVRSQIWSESQADFGSLRGGHDTYLIKKQDLNKVIDQAKRALIQAIKK